jgi:hypothetical protein
MRAADAKEKLVEASREHLARMKNLHAKVDALARQGAQGGEADKLHAAAFYVAEAELLLLDANSETR